MSLVKTLLPVSYLLAILKIHCPLPPASKLANFLISSSSAFCIRAPSRKMAAAFSFTATESACIQTLNKLETSFTLDLRLLSVALAVALVAENYVVLYTMESIGRVMLSQH